MKNTLCIDAHQHFWLYNENEYGWIAAEMAALKRDFTPRDLAPLLKEAGVDGSVAVQARQTLQETEWLLQLAGGHDEILGVVGWVDLCDPGVEETLTELARHPKFVGVRHVLQDEPDPRFMLREDFLRGLSRLAGLDLVYDILIRAHQLPEAIWLVQLFPNQRFVLDHLAKPLVRDKITQPWERGLRQLAGFTNVSCKLSGLVTEADPSHWSAGDFWPYLDIAFEAFGPDRLMIGSDWPVCTLAGSYEAVMKIVFDFLDTLPVEERRAVLGFNARRVYGLSCDETGMA